MTTPSKDQVPPTYIIDIDGTILRHHGGGLKYQATWKPEILPKVDEAFKELNEMGARIILMTGRPESMRAATEHQLSKLGLFWDELLMGVGRGIRYIVNDSANGKPTCYAVTVERNAGLGALLK